MAAGIAAAAAQEMHNPRISHTAVQWGEVATSLSAAEGQEPTPQDSTPHAIARLNALTGNLFAHIGASPVPVLLPFNAADLLRDRAAGSERPPTDYLGTFKTPAFFQAGPGGYDAAFSFYTRDVPDIGFRYA